MIGSAAFFDPATATVPRSGRPPRATKRYRAELRNALRKGPLRFGYVFTVWSIARLAAHLHRRTGIRFSTDWLRRLARAEGFVVARPKHTLKNKRKRRTNNGRLKSKGSLHEA